MILRTYTSTTDARAQTGSRIVAAPDTAIEIPNTRFPPNLSDNHPPGIWVTR